MILTKMYEKLNEFKDVKIKKLIIGLGYTAVHTEAGLGLSYTLISRKDSCTVNHNAGKISGRKVGEALETLSDYKTNIISRTVLIALFNSTVDFNKISSAGSDAVELMGIMPEDCVYMIGYFEPLIKAIESRCKNLKIIEERHGGTTADIDSGDWNSDANLITSTSLINGSFDDIAEKCKKSRVNCLMGPSTPLAPDLFKGCNFDYLAGLRPLNFKSVFEIVAEGGGTRLFNKYCEKIVVKC